MLSTWCLITSIEAKYWCLVEIKRFFKRGDLFLSLPPVGQVIKMTCKQRCGKEQLTVLGGEGRQMVFKVCHKQ